jgi:hypothetical protein
LCPFQESCEQRDPCPQVCPQKFLWLYCQLSHHLGNKTFLHFFHEFIASEFLCVLLPAQNVSIHKCKIKEVEKEFLPSLHWLFKSIVR